VHVYERFIGRQPVFDRRLNVFGYELLFRSSRQNVFQPRKDASSSVIVDSTMLFDFQTLVGHAKAFINADENALLRGALKLLPADRIIVEILESVSPKAEVIAACAELRDGGYVLALDDFVDHPKWEPLLALASFLKVDFRMTGEDARRAVAARYLPKGLQLLAEKVETQGEVDQARSMGYSYFQGYFFCKPTVVEGREIPGNKLNYIQLIEAVNAPDFAAARIEEVLKREPALVYKLLRYLNSPLLGLRNEIRSITHAIALIGEKEFRRWVSIVCLVSMAEDKSPELIRTALTRAYFCEGISASTGMSAQKSDLFLMGLLSVTDAILDLPMHAVLSRLPVSADVREALSSGSSNPFCDVYGMLLSYERADWKKLSCLSSKLGCPEEGIAECYLSATSRAGGIPL
jgi:c-di-GMP-related signal transduction protein